MAGQCQYCAKGFCADHGAIHDDDQEICVEEHCQRLRVDVELHLVFKSEARVRNDRGRCGEPDCAQPPALRCDRCMCRYCGEHLRQVLLTVTRGGELQSEAVAMCDHCRARLPLWTEK